MKLNIGAIVGILGGLLGATMGIGAAFAASPIAGVIVSVVVVFVFFLIYKAFIKPEMEYSRLKKNGIQCTGTIIDISETNTRINNQPLCKIELQVEIPGKPVYVVTTKSVISYVQIARFQPGAKIPIFVDPVNNEKVVLIRKGDMDKSAPIVNSSPEVMNELKNKLAELQKENDRIKLVGVYSKAIVTKFTNMGVNVNGNNPLATIEVQVLPDNEPAFAATVKGAIKDTSIPLFQPGEEIFVKYDPSDKTKVSIEHS